MLTIFWGLIKKGKKFAEKNRGRIGEERSVSQAFIPSLCYLSLQLLLGVIYHLQFLKQGICALGICGHLCEGCGKPQDRWANDPPIALIFLKGLWEKLDIYTKINI